MTIVLDSGALIALERNDRAMWVRLKTALRAGTVPVSHGGVIGQVWRGGSRQALLAKALTSIDVRPLDDALGRAAGVLLSKAKRTDVVDAALVSLCADDDRILTSDPDDMHALVNAASRDIDVIAV
jgi:hypothetical protein